MSLYCVWIGPPAAGWEGRRRRNTLQPQLLRHQSVRSMRSSNQVQGVHQILLCSRDTPAVHSNDAYTASTTANADHPQDPADGR